MSEGYFAAQIGASSCDDEPTPATVDVTVSLQEFGDDQVMLEVQDGAGYVAVTLTQERVRELVVALTRCAMVAGEVYERDDEPPVAELQVRAAGWPVGAGPRRHT